MAFILSDFKPGDTTGNAPAIHTYTSADVTTQIDTAGYFNEISDILSVGDVIYTATNTGASPVYGWKVVNSNTGGVVDVDDATQVGGTDSR